MFKLIKENPETEYVKLRIASQAYTLGDVVMLDRTSNAVDVVPATAATTTFGVYAVAMETVPATAIEALFCIITPEQTWEADAANASNVNHNMQRMILVDAVSVNNTGTDDATKEAVFMQTGIAKESADKHLVGKFLKVANVTA